MSIAEVTGATHGAPAPSVLRPAASCPAPVKRAVMRQQWRHLSFLHVAVSPRTVQRLLPPGLSVDCSEGAAWVGIVPFQLGVAPARGPVLPWVGAFPELNVRTYVTGPAGPGIAFLSLDAPRLTAVAAARATYHIRYRWSRMRLHVTDDVVTYSSRHHCADADLAVRIQGDVHGLTDLEQFLTARWHAYGWNRRGRLWVLDVEHPPWSLRRASLLRFRQTLLDALGVVPLSHEVHVLHSTAIDARMSAPRRLP
jgi:uncharacterized protein YqjF (DUF2071 family)